MNDRWTDQLSAYLDQELAEKERLEVEAHLVTCAECREVLAGLSAVAEQARKAPSMPPDLDLWPAIAARIATPSRVTTTAPVEPAREAGGGEAARPAQPRRPARRADSGSWFGWRLTFTLPQAAAVAATLMVVAGASVWMVLGRGPIPATRGPATSGGSSPSVSAPSNPTAAMPPPAGETSSGPATSAAVASYDTRYDATVAELQRLLAEDRDRLDPKTVEVLERNLATIDHALAEARRAVEADPSSLYLRNHLASVMKRKVNLLKTATLLAAYQG